MAPMAGRGHMAFNSGPCGLSVGCASTCDVLGDKIKPVGAVCEHTESRSYADDNAASGRGHPGGGGRRHDDGYVRLEILRVL